MTTIAPRPSTAIVARAAGDTLPMYVTRDQARAIVNAARTTTHRLLLDNEFKWWDDYDPRQVGGLIETPTIHR